MREDDRTGVFETRPDRQYRMPPCVPFTLNFVLSGMILVAEPIGLAL